MTALTWHKGPPPHVGWWNASVNRIPAAWRWWNGQRWSEFAYGTYSPAAAARKAEIPVSVRIEWSRSWPENARVARINPDTGEVTGAGPMPCEVQA